MKRLRNYDKLQKNQHIIKPNLYMSNKTLVIIIVVVVALFAGTVAAMQYQNARRADRLETAGDQTADQAPENVSQQQDSGEPASSAPESNQPTNTPSTAMNECKRDFDEQKLKTAQVSIKNRTVELDVKDFGKIQVQLYDQDAPKTVENFLRLVNAGYYDCLTFHRVSHGFVIQGGDPTGAGSGGDSAFGGSFADELNPDTPSYKAGYQKGVLAMANAGPDTNTSQFFILLDDATSWMPHNYTIFGKVSAGQDVVDKIGAVPVTPVMSADDGTPKTPVVIAKASIIK